MLQAQFLEIRKSRNFTEQLNLTFGLIRENFRLLGKCVLFIVGPAALLAGAFIGWFFIDLLSMAGDTPSPGRILDAAPSVLVGIFFAFVSAILLYGVVIDFIRLYLDRGGANFDIGDLWSEVRGDLGKIIGTFFLMALMIGLAYLVIALLAFTKSVALVILAFMIFGVLAIYAYVPLSLLLPVRLCEDQGFFDSVSRSFELAKGYWWLTLGVIVIPSMVANAISGVFLFPVQMAASFMRFSSIDAGGGSLKLIVTIFLMLGMVLGYLLAALPALAATLQYFNLVEKHEGIGLMERIEAIGGEEDTNLNANIF